MTLGNIHSSIRNKPSAHAWIPLALLPIPPKKVDKIPGFSKAQQEQESSQTLHNVLWDILCPLADVHKAGTIEEGIRMECGDQNIRYCFPILCSWIADHPENLSIHGIMGKRCAICPCPIDQLGDYQQELLPPRDHKQYRRWYLSSEYDSMSADGIKIINNALWHLRNIIPTELIRPDILHGIYLKMLEHLME